jgi:hypothetical protein
MTFPISVNPTTGVQTSPIRAITVAGTADPAAGAEMTVFTVPAAPGRRGSCCRSASPWSAARRSQPGGFT